MCILNVFIHIKYKNSEIESSSVHLLCHFLDEEKLKLFDYTALPTSVSRWV